MSTTRREALAALGGTALAGISATAFARPETLAASTARPIKAISVDADLLAACERHQQAFDQLSALVNAHCERYGVDVPESAYQEQAQLCEVMCERVGDVRDVPARTLAGLRAKAQTLWLDEGELAGRESKTLLQSLLRDLRSGRPA